MNRQKLLVVLILVGAILYIISFWIEAASDGMLQASKSHLINVSIGLSLSFVLLLNASGRPKQRGALYIAGCCCLVITIILIGLYCTHSWIWAVTK